MRTVIRAIALAAAIFLWGATARSEEQYAVKVNGVGIPQATFDLQWKVFLDRSGIPGSHADKAGQLTELRQQVIDRLVDEELLFQEAKNRKFLASGDRVDAELAKVRGQFPSPEAFQEELRQNGYTDATLKTLIERNLSIVGLVEGEIAKGVTVSDAEVHEFYGANGKEFATPEQVRARHILVEVDAKADEAARKAAREKAEGLLAKLQGGADFAELAKSSSDCPSAPEGGDLGFFAHGQMVAPFDKAAFALEPGKLSGIVETEFGFHIIRVEERKAAGTVPEAEAAPSIRDFLTRQKGQAAVVARIKALREKAKIEVLLKL